MFKKQNIKLPYEIEVLRNNQWENSGLKCRLETNHDSIKTIAFFETKKFENPPFEQDEMIKLTLNEHTALVATIESFERIHVPCSLIDSSEWFYYLSKIEYEDHSLLTTKLEKEEIHA